MIDFLETIKAIDGKVYNLKYHQKRYENVLKSFHIRKFENLQDYLTPPQDGIYRCRLVYNTQDIYVEYIRYEKRKINTLKIVYNDFIDYTHKSTARKELDNLFDIRDMCDDVLIVKNSLLTDTTIANIALYDGTKWLTPKKPLLCGTTRQRLLDDKKIIEADIKVDEIFTYKKIALLNAMVDFDIIASDDLKDIIC